MHNQDSNSGDLEICSEIWVLADDRPGNYSQAIGLAKRIIEIASNSDNQKLNQVLNFRLEIKKIKYNSFANLPNFLKINGFFGLNSLSKKSILSQKKAPQVIISAGRKTAPMALYLKNYYNHKTDIWSRSLSNQRIYDKVFCIQIMNPDLNFGLFSKSKEFDLIVLPNHDKIMTQSNVVRMIGSVSFVNTKFLEEEYQKFVHQLGQISSPKIALLVGGSSKRGNFTTKIAKDLSVIVSKISNNMDAHLLVLNSRRTSQEITDVLELSLDCKKTFFKWQKNDWQNPYFAVLKAADFIIATGDSISMCSEICSLGKPTYIFNPTEICSKKHLKFHQDLFEKGFAKKLDQKSDKLDTFLVKKLDETTRVAQIVVNNFLNKLRR